MSNEAQVRTDLRLIKGNLSYQAHPGSYNADVLTANPAGPTPGSLAIATGGTNVSLAQLTALGGLCYLFNKDSTNFVTYGIWNGAAFLPLGEIKAGEGVVLRLSRYLLTGMVGTASINSLRLVADTAPCQVIVDAFDP